VNRVQHNVIIIVGFAINPDLGKGGQKFRGTVMYSGNILKQGNKRGGKLQAKGRVFKNKTGKNGQIIGLRRVVLNFEDYAVAVYA